MSSLPISNVVVDASLAAQAILPVAAHGEVALSHFSRWHRTSTQLFAPDILVPELVSVIRQAIYTRVITAEDGRTAVEDIFRLGIVITPADSNLCQRALAWSEKLGQSKAYDGFYLALAEQLRAELWTGDKKLVNRSLQIGVDWVHAFEPE